MVKLGLLKLIDDNMPTEVRLEFLFKIADMMERDKAIGGAKRCFNDKIIGILYSAAKQMRDIHNFTIAYQCLAAMKKLGCSVKFEYVLLENEFREKLDLEDKTRIFELNEAGNGINGQLAAVMKENNQLLRLCQRSLQNKNKIRVAILLEWTAAWPKVQSLYEAMVNDKRFQCDIVAIDMQEPFASENNYEKFIDFLTEQNIPFFKERSYSIEEMKPDILVYTNPYDHHHMKFNACEMNRRGIKIVYLPYAIQYLIDDRNRMLGYNLSIHNMAWRIYTRSQNDKKRYARYCNKGSGHVVAMGTPFADYLRESAKRISCRKGKRKVFLWTPDYGFKGNTSTFIAYGEQIINYFLNHKEVSLIVRPHPLFNGVVLGENYLTKEELQNFYDLCDEAENIYVDDSGDMTESFCLSDALISDISSVLIEYMLTGKPIMLLNTEHTPNYKNIKDDDSAAFEHFYSGSSFEKIIEFISMVKDGKDLRKEERLGIVENHFVNIDQNIGEKIKDDIKEAYENF
jgi:hypothetical protein